MADDDSPPAASGDLLTRKYGPLPVWGYMGILLGLVLAWRVYAGHKTAADTGSGATSTATTKTPTSGYQLPSNIPPQYTTVNEDTYSNIGNTNSGNTSSVVNNNPAPPLPTVTPPAATPVPTPAAPAGVYVTVTKYHSGDASKRTGIPSTVYGISQEIYGNGKYWKDIWADPKNAALVAKRGKPEHIQTGDKIWVAAKAATAPNPPTPAVQPTH